MSESSFIGQSKVAFKEGAVVYRKGDMAQQMFVILSGRIRMYVGFEPKGDWVEELAKGDFFGEGSLLEPIPRDPHGGGPGGPGGGGHLPGHLPAHDPQNPEVSVKMMQRLAQRNRDWRPGWRARWPGGPRPAARQTTVSLVSVISGKKFHILSHGALVGRFDPNTGIHPDIDLTEEDPQLSVSRRHAGSFANTGATSWWRRTGWPTAPTSRATASPPGTPGS